MAKDYYSILGIEKNATDEEIKSAYRKLSMKYHPDRHVNDSEEEQKKAEDMFKDINEAYSVLSDPEKKRNYDTFGSADDMSGGFDPTDAFEIFRRHFGGDFGGGRGGFQQAAPSGSNIKMEIPLGIKEFYCGGSKKVKYNRNVRCTVCHGAGGSGERVCFECGGSGVTQKICRSGFQQTIIQQSCPFCKGKGKTVEYACSRCNGTGFETKTNEVTIDFQPGMQNGTGSVLRGEGNESADPRGENGSFIAVVVHKYDTTRYKIEGYNIIETVNVPYYDALLGTTIKVVLPDEKTEKTIVLNEATPDKKFYKLVGCGVKIGGQEAGDYYVQINYSYPKTLSSAEKTALKQIKKSKKSKN